MYDVIGDVHGQGAKLRALLARLGYVERAGHWRSPEGRQAAFVGDLVDRGPEQLAVLDTVRRMVDDGCARLVLGNHEFNALGYATRHPDTGGFLRPRCDKNRRQHGRFLAEVGEDSARHREWVHWFRQHPLALDLGGIRVVHAWWDDAAIGTVEAARGGADRPLSDDIIVRCYKDRLLKDARKLLTCGVEWELPEGAWIEDKEGHKHPDARLAVWRHWAERLREIAIVPAGSEDAVPDIGIPDEHRIGPIDGKPILFGHHWFSEPVKLETPKVACVDWSAGAGGPLVAYRWDGEAELSDDHFVAVGEAG